jgi:hypothetical protein
MCNVEAAGGKQNTVTQISGMLKNGTLQINA